MSVFLTAESMRRSASYFRIVDRPAARTTSRRMVKKPQGPTTARNAIAAALSEALHRESAIPRRRIGRCRILAGERWETPAP